MLAFKDLLFKEGGQIVLNDFIIYLNVDAIWSEDLMGKEIGEEVRVDDTYESLCYLCALCGCFERKEEK